MSTLRVIVAVSFLMPSALVHGDHDEPIRRIGVDVDAYGCKPCVELGYVEEFVRRRDAHQEIESQLVKLHQERAAVASQLEVKEMGTRAIEERIRGQSELLARLESELAPFDREEKTKGFDEIEVLERERASRKLSKAERERLENLKKKRHDFRENRKIVQKIQRRLELAERIAGLRRQIEDFEKIPPVEELRQALAKKNAAIAGLEERAAVTFKPFIKAKRDLVFCTSHFELRRILRENRVQYQLPYLDGDY
jgi:chromosome segregation ATPase